MSLCNATITGWGDPVALRWKVPILKICSYRSVVYPALWARPVSEGVFWNLFHCMIAVWADWRMELS
jgi:hypothetical protein